MALHGSVTRLVLDLKSEDSSVRNKAAQLIWERYFRGLLELARNNRAADPPCADEEDVLQSMYKSFCLRQQRGEFDLANRDALWSLLVTITLNKTRDVAKHHCRSSASSSATGARREMTRRSWRWSRWKQPNPHPRKPPSSTRRWSGG